MSKVRGFVILIGLVLSAALARAEAVPDAAYDAALDRALTAHAAGDFGQAEASMREAHALSPNARTLRGLGVILYAQGRYLEAIEPLEAALQSETRALSAELRRGVEELLVRVWQRVGRLTLRIDPAESRVLIDGAAPVPHGPTEIVLAAGEHRVEVSAPERAAYALTLRIQAGSRDSLHVVLAPVRRAGSAGAAESGRPLQAAQNRPDAAPHAPRWTPRLRNSLSIGGAALFAAGAASWLTGYLRFVALEKHCAGKEAGCAFEDAEARYDRKRIAPLTSAGVVVLSTGAALLLAVGAVELWRWYSRRHASRTGDSRWSSARWHDARLQLSGNGLSLQAQF
jgi:tetratricopeptide (TPR) repeat protein